MDWGEPTPNESSKENDAKGVNIIATRLWARRLLIFCAEAKGRPSARSGLGGEAPPRRCAATPQCLPLKKSPERLRPAQDGWRRDDF